MGIKIGDQKKRRLHKEGVGPEMLSPVGLMPVTIAMRFGVVNRVLQSKYDNHSGFLTHNTPSPFLVSMAMRFQKVCGQVSVGGYSHHRTRAFLTEGWADFFAKPWTTWADGHSYFFCRCHKPSSPDYFFGLINVKTQKVGYKCPGFPRAA